jgi:hypothetical protein
MHSKRGISVFLLAESNDVENGWMILEPFASLRLERRSLSTALSSD